MAEPAITAEIEFTTGIWTNVTNLLRSGDTRRGKSRAIDPPSPGNATFIFRNHLRQFDPDYASNISPGNVIPDKGIRITVTYNAIVYPLFTGQIDGIIQRYDGPDNAEAIMECTDGLGKLVNDQLGSPWETQMLLESPRAWFRLDEKEGPLAVERVAARHGTYEGTPEFDLAGFTFDDGTCIKFDSTDDRILFPSGVFRTDVTAPWQMTFLLHFPTAQKPTAGNIAILMFDALFPYGLTAWLDDNGFLNVRTWVPGSPTFTYIRSLGAFGDFTFPIADDIGVLVTIQASTTSPYLKIFNGSIPVHDVTSLLGTGSKLPASTLVMGQTTYVYRIDEILTFDANMTTSQLGALDVASRGWSVDSAWSRIHRILDVVNWPAGFRDITVDWDTFLGPASLQQSPLDHFTALASMAEHRTPFVTRNGTLRILSRQSHTAPPYTVSQGTFGDGAGELPYTELGQVTLDTARVENVVHRIWTDKNGKELNIIVEDNGIAAGQRRQAGDTIMSEYGVPTYEHALASFRLAKLAKPIPYIEGLKISPRKSPDTLFPQVLGRELGDRITYVRRPQNVGAPISRNVIIEGISHNFAARHWETTFLVDTTDALGFFHFDTTQWDTADWRFVV